ncbi:MAG: HAMP domain-containing sensor histidine kinase [Thermoguttaceae bacterium]
MMRWPIQVQLLLPMLSIVVLAIGLASVISAYHGGARARQLQEDNLRRVVATLIEARFPLREPVLRQMGGLSGAEFVFLDNDQQAEAATLQIGAADLAVLRTLPIEAPGAQFSSSPTVLLGGRAYLSRRVPVAGRGGLPRTGWLVALYPEDRWSAAAWQAACPALVAGAAAIAAVLLVTMLLAQRFGGPIRQLVTQTAAIAGGNFQPVAVSPRNDEIRDLAVSINQMTERLSRYESEVRRSEQLRTLGQLGAGIAHQLRNAATGGRMAIELHQRECRADAARESLNVALRQLQLMESYLQRFLTLGQSHAAARQTVHVGDLVDDVLALVRPTCAHAGIELAVAQSPCSVTVCGDPQELRQLVLNLVMNAVEATKGHGDRPALVGIEVQRSEQGRAVIEVKDSGPGPHPAVAQRLFEPFVTGKPDGTGLGLFVARQIAEDHGGSIRWQRPCATTCFRVELPLAIPSPSAGEG